MYITKIVAYGLEFATGMASLFVPVFQTIFLVETDPVGAAGVYDGLSSVGELSMTILGISLGTWAVNKVFTMLPTVIKRAKSKRKKARA